MKMIKIHKSIVAISDIMVFNAIISNIMDTKIDDEMKVLLS